MKYIPCTHGLKILKEIYEAICGADALYQTFVGKVYRQGLYWPMAIKDVVKFVYT